jgi:hypothetical protein
MEPAWGAVETTLLTKHRAEASAEGDNSPNGDDGSKAALMRAAFLLAQSRHRASFASAKRPPGSPNNFERSNRV